MKTCPRCFEQNEFEAEQCESCGHRFDSNTDWNVTQPTNQDTRILAPGEQIADRYEILKELGRGGMGVVYLVRDSQLRGLEVALKMIHPQLVADPEAQRRFIDEVIICQQLNHPSIIRVFHLDRWQNLQFFTMEYVGGRDLRSWLDERKTEKPPFTLPEVAGVMDLLLDALAYAHEKTVHRDVKPENIIVEGKFPEVRIKVLDFGIARTLSASHFTRTAQGLGTAYYMSPEQMTGGEVGLRSDLYSVGMVLYEMLTGKIAMGRFRLPTELFPNLPREIDDVLTKALSPEPDERYQSAGEIQIALKDALTAYEVRLVELREEEEQHRKLARIESLLEDGQKAFDKRRWEQAGRIFKQVLELDDGNKQAEALMEEAGANKARLDKLETDARKAEASGEFEKAISLLSEIAGLCEDRQALEDRLRLLEQQLENKRQEESERQQKAEAERRRREQEKQEAARRRQAQEEKRRQEQEHLEKEKLQKERKQRKAEERRQAEEEERREEQERLEAEQRQKEEDHSKAERATSSRRKARFGVIAAAVVVVVAGILYFTNEGMISPTAGSIIEGTLSGMKYAYIPPGSFTMGSPSSEKDRFDNERQHRVSLTQGFYMQTTEVTQGQWKAVMGNNPSHFKNCGVDCPMEVISWNDIQEFIRRLNSKEGTDNYRLPTEAEWEYAARAGSTTAFANGDITEIKCGHDPNLNEMGWYCGNTKGQTPPAGQKKANAWGLYDMHGNVYEWCQDWYGKYPSGPVTDPTGPSAGSYRVIRGGSWNSNAGNCRSANRNYDHPGYRYYNLGFRLARDP